MFYFVLQSIPAIIIEICDRNLKLVSFSTNFKKWFVFFMDMRIALKI